jgi:hypothetical protein
MHIHLPKPTHSWREFVGEVGIIVVGVLIAIGAEQVVEAMHVRHETNEAFHAVRSELALAAGVFEERVAVQPCLDRRLAQVGVIVSTARQSHRLPDVGEIGRPPVRPVQSNAFASASSRGLAGKFAEADREKVQLHHSQSASYVQDVQNEQEMWATLRLLEHQPGTIDGALLADAVSTLERLKFRSYLNGLDADQLLTSIRSMGIRAKYSILADEGENYDRVVLLRRVRARPVCNPLMIDGKSVT